MKAVAFVIIGIIGFYLVAGNNNHVGSDFKERWLAEWHQMSTRQQAYDCLYYHYNHDAIIAQVQSKSRSSKKESKELLDTVCL